MCAVFKEQAEEEQFQRLSWVQERLAGSGVRTLLVRRLRLTLAQNRYHPLEPDGPVLVIGHITVSIDGGYVVRCGDDPITVFLDVAETAAYISSLMTAASSGGSTVSGSSSRSNHPYPRKA